MSISTFAPSIDTNLEYRDIYLKNGENVQIRVWNALSRSSSLCNWSMPPPNMRTFMSRFMLRRLVFQINITSSGGTSLLAQANRFAPRAFPISSIIVNEQLSLNNQAFPLQTLDVIHPLSRYLHKVAIQQSPSFLDTYANYADGYGAINNPLGTYSTALSDTPPRGGFPYKIIGTPTATSLNLEYDFTEAVLIPPMMVDEYGDTLGFTNLRTVELTCNFTSDLTRLLSAAFSGVTGLAIALSSDSPKTAEIITMYTTPPSDYVPRSLTYRNIDLMRIVSTFGTMTSGVSMTATSTNMQLQCIPEWLLVCVRPNISTNTYATADYVAAISNVNINFNNISGILSTSNAQSLYSISRENGLSDKWEQFAGYTQKDGTIGSSTIGTTGSFVKLMFGKDISIGGNSEYIGKLGAYNLQITVTATQYTGSTLTDAQMVVIIGYPSKIILHETAECEKVLGFAPSETDTYNYVSYKNLEGFYGGSFKDVMFKIVNFLQPINKFLKDTRLISTVASAIPHPVSQLVSKKAHEMGYGMSFAGDTGGMRIAGDTGGKILTRSDLKRRLADV